MRDRDGVARWARATTSCTLKVGRALCLTDRCGLRAGLYDVRVEAVSGAGLRSPAATATLVVDETPPRPRGAPVSWGIVDHPASSCCLQLSCL